MILFSLVFLHFHPPSTPSFSPSNTTPFPPQGPVCCPPSPAPAGWHTHHSCLFTHQLPQEPLVNNTWIYSNSSTEVRGSHYLYWIFACLNIYLPQIECKNLKGRTLFRELVQEPSNSSNRLAGWLNIRVYRGDLNPKLEIILCFYLKTRTVKSTTLLSRC